MSLRTLRTPTTILVALAATTLISACDGTASSTARGLTAKSALVLLNSDYKAATVSLYDPASMKLVDDCMTVNELSKDTALPSGTQGGEVVVIDREQSLLDFVDPASCHVRGQLSL